MKSKRSSRRKNWRKNKRERPKRESRSREGRRKSLSNSNKRPSSASKSPKTPLSPQIQKAKGRIPKRMAKINALFQRSSLKKQ